MNSDVREIKELMGKANASLDRGDRKEAFSYLDKAYSRLGSIPPKNYNEVVKIYRVSLNEISKTLMRLEGKNDDLNYYIT